MGFGLQTESSAGDFTPVVKFDARAGRFFRVDREQTAAGWQTDNVDITQGFNAVLDLANVQVGFAYFAPGMAPNWSVVPLGQPLPAKPSENHKQCFKIMLMLGKSVGGDVREFASQAKAVIGAFDKLHTEYEAATESKKGMLPVVTLKGTTPVKSSGGGQTSTNYAPIFEITKWVKRPAELTDDGVPSGSVAAKETVSRHVEPPKASEPVLVDDGWE